MEWISARVARDRLVGIGSGDLFRVVRVDAVTGKVELEQLPPRRPARVVVGQAPEDWSESEADIDSLADQLAALLDVRPGQIGIRRHPEPEIMLSREQAAKLLKAARP